MKPLFAVVFVALLTGVCRGGPTERAILAAMKLSEQPNYSWTSTVFDDARTYSIDGKRNEAGYTWVRLPIVKSIAQRLGREADPEVEAVFKGNAAFVIRTHDGWKTLKELPKRTRDWNDEIEFWPTPASMRGNLSATAMAGLDPFDQSAFPPPYVVLPPLPAADEGRRPYSNAQFALSHPHDELAVIVSSYTALQVEGDVATGTLSDLGAQLLLVRDGQDHLTPLCAAGAFKLLMKGGVVTRYSLRLEGILLVDRKKIRVRQESSTYIKDVGTTLFQVADELRRKLD